MTTDDHWLVPSNHSPCIAPPALPLTPYPPSHAPCIAPPALPLRYGDLEIKALDAEDPNGSPGARALSYVVDDGAKTFRLTPADLISALEEYREMMEATELHEVRRS
jgi:hypothetical protein